MVAMASVVTFTYCLDYALNTRAPHSVVPVYTHHRIPSALNCGNGIPAFRGIFQSSPICSKYRPPFVTTTCSAANKPSPSPEISSAAKLRSEVLSPFRSVRMFFYLAFIASGSLGGLIALTQLLGALSNPSKAAAVPDILEGLGIDIGAVSIFAFLYYNENKARDVQLARLSREESLSNLKLRLSEQKIISMSSLRGFARLVICAGPAAFINEAFQRSKPFTETLLERGVLVVPFVTDGNSLDLVFEEDKELTEVITKRKRLWQLSPVYVSQWSQWLDDQKKLAGISPDSPVYLSLRMDGRVRGSGVGHPPWNALRQPLPSVSLLPLGSLEQLLPRLHPSPTMAETPSSQAQPHSSETSDSPLYWCYHCDKRVSIVDPTQNVSDIKCMECNSGFVESISSAPAPMSSSYFESPDPVEDPNFGSQFLRILRIISHGAQMGGWDNDDGNDEEEGEGEEHELEDVDDNEYPHRDEENRLEIEGRRREPLVEPEDEEDLRRIRRELLRSRIRNLAIRTRIGRNRMLDSAEVLMGLEDGAIEFTLQMPESDRYIGNPEDYVDGAAYDALLETLAESEGGGTEGAPPAAKSVISALPTVVITADEEAVVCAVCKDVLAVGETAKKLPCGHLYHGICIEPWLASKNSCPVCRFELPTDDPDYEEGKRKKVSAIASGASASGRSDTTSGWWE